MEMNTFFFIAKGRHPEHQGAINNKGKRSKCQRHSLIWECLHGRHGVQVWQCRWVCPPDDRGRLAVFNQVEGVCPHNKPSRILQILPHRKCLHQVDCRPRVCVYQTYQMMIECDWGWLSGSVNLSLITVLWLESNEYKGDDCSSFGGNCIECEKEDEMEHQEITVLRNRMKKNDGE